MQQTAGKKVRAAEIIRRLREVISRPETELDHRNPFELLVAVVLSAQCTDARVNQTTPALFEAYPTPEALSRATVDEVFPLIRSISYPNNKAKHLVGLAQRLCAVYNGVVPASIEALQTLPGVGRKTANVVASVAFGVEAIPVDTHVFRVGHRLGLARRTSKTPRAVEEDLSRVLPTGTWAEGHHLFILLGRYTCLARAPKCEGCVLTDLCPHFDRLQKLPAPRQGLDAKRGPFYCGSRRHYLDRFDEFSDRNGTLQPTCPKCGSQNLFETRKGTSLKRVLDFKINAFPS